MIPFQITFLDFPESDAVWMAVQKRIEKLEHFFDRIVRCEVAISCPHRHRQADRLYHIQIHLIIPGEDVIVNRNHPKDETHRDIYVAIGDSFNAAERILQDRVRIVRHKTKFHEQQSEEGKISKVFYQECFGFLETSNGRECYFGENSITNENFNHLKIGQRVRFHEEPGEKGPQVTSMAVI
jgi:cold shock CspA family protein